VQHPDKKPAPRHGKRLAVLEFKNDAGLDRAFFSDAVRAAVKSIRSLWAVQIVTRENMLEMLKSDDAADEVQAGRALDADWIVSGRLSRLADGYELTLHLLGTKQGALLTTATAAGKDAASLAANVPAAVRKLFPDLK